MAVDGLSLKVQENQILALLGEPYPPHCDVTVMSSCITVMSLCHRSQWCWEVHYYQHVDWTLRA